MEKSCCEWCGSFAFERKGQSVGNNKDGYSSKILLLHFLEQRCIGFDGVSRSQIECSGQMSLATASCSGLSPDQEKSSQSP